MEGVKERIKEFSTKSGISLNALGRMMGLSESALHKESKVNVNAVARLLEQIDNLSAEWLMRGKGEMYLGNTTTGIVPEDNSAYYEYLIRGKNNRIEELEREIARLKSGSTQIA